jgi:RecA/RadA recombinase
LGEQKITSNEIVEISGCSGSGKTFLCLKMACLALIERDVAVLYVDTTNYLNRDNVMLSLKNFMSAGDTQSADKTKKAEKARELMARLQVVQIHDMDRLILLLAKLLSRLEHKQLNFPLKMIVIDSLSSLFWESGSQSMGKSHHDKQQ